METFIRIKRKRGDLPTESLQIKNTLKKSHIEKGKKYKQRIILELTLLIMIQLQFL